MFREMEIKLLRALHHWVSATCESAVTSRVWSFAETIVDCCKGNDRAVVCVFGLYWFNQTVLDVSRMREFIVELSENMMAWNVYEKVAIK